MVDYVGVSDIERIVNAVGPAEFIAQLAGEIEADYRRWPEFEKAPRLASHSPVGVIELMPATDGKLYSFKYINGHPENTAEGLLTVTAFGVLADILVTPMIWSELLLAVDSLQRRKLRPVVVLLMVESFGSRTNNEELAQSLMERNVPVCKIYCEANFSETLSKFSQNTFTKDISWRQPVLSHLT